MTMDHAEAVRSGAAEKYLLGDLDEDERSQYEEHFFDCPECAEELKVTETFLAGARKVLARDAARPAAGPRAGWHRLLRPVPLAAAAAILLLGADVIYQHGAAVPRLRAELAAAEAPQPASWRLLSVTRGETPTIVASPARRWVGLTLGTPSGPTLASYRCDVRDREDRVLWSFEVPGPAGGDEIEIVLPAARLAPGAYAITLSRPGPEPGPEVARYPFTVQAGGE